MAQAVVIADEITAAGFRLAGIGAIVPVADESGALSEEVRRAFEQACRDATLVFVTAELARYLPRARLDAALEAIAPTVAVIPDIEARSISADIGVELRRTLGVSA